MWLVSYHIGIGQNVVSNLLGPREHTCLRMDSDEASRLNNVESAPLATFLGQYPSMTTISPIASYHAHIAAQLAVADLYHLRHWMPWDPILSNCHSSCQYVARLCQLSTLVWYWKLGFESQVARGSGMKQRRKYYTVRMGRESCSVLCVFSRYNSLHPWNIFVWPRIKALQEKLCVCFTHTKSSSSPSINSPNSRRPSETGQMHKTRNVTWKAKNICTDIE